ncbi:MAG: glutamine amidotransferase family protein [Woeseiaceae bacterium]|jgi:glutamate synthase domain-containing protein 1|nr:glutamine amidotransferase family protein [Woeseiaceae bacterium]|tara:strand:- start:522 stop:1418 length:897 start_codon:yes stop_codon:yes gene_type:complete
MCGIVGIYLKNDDLNSTLGQMLAAMLVEMSDRGPDSAGVALYRDPVAASSCKLTLHAATDYDWSALQSKLAAHISADVALRVHASHAVITAATDVDRVRTWLKAEHADVRVMSAGSAIEIYKEKGLPREFVEQFKLHELNGSHALGHTRMATESAVTTEHSHPFSTGMDLCLVHNGSLSNHNRLRRKLRDEGVDIQTDNDTEVAAGYLMWRLREGDTLEAALERALVDLDGFYTFAIGTKDGFAVLRDPIACKPAVMAETDDWVAMASEFRAIAQLPGVEHATIWEPSPATVYTWGRG